jgi:hypothetical protein
MNRRKLPRELVNYQREAQASGWVIKPIAHGWLWKPPAGEAITVHAGHGPTSDPRTVKNAATRLRRAGLTGAGARPDGRKS